MKWLSFFKNSSRPQSELGRSLEKIIGDPPRNLMLYKRAFTHPAEQKKTQQGQSFNYERLEFLGDALIGASTANYLFLHFPKANEGELTKMRSQIVSRKALNEAGERLCLKQWLDSDLPEHQHGKNISGNLFEALTGAIYSDLGFDIYLNFIHRNLLAPFAAPENLQGKVLSYKSLLIEYGQRHKKSVVFKTKPNRKKGFESRLFIDESYVGKACAPSKKKAEEQVARKAQNPPNPRRVDSEGETED